MNDNRWVRSDDRGPVRTITMNRPETRNALSGGLITALFAALTAADTDPAVHAVVLTGADPAFCAGVDLKEAARDGAAYFAQFESRNCITQVAQMRTPVIGAVNGAAFTGGLEIALGCDFLIASDRALFADTHVRVGVLPGGGMTAHLPQFVGQAWARRLSMTGEVLDAAAALRLGLVTEVVPHAELLDRSLAVAEQIAEVDPRTMIALKETYSAGAAVLTEPAIAAEKRVSSQHPTDHSAIERRRIAVMARNRAKIDWQ